MALRFAFGSALFALLVAMPFVARAEEDSYFGPQVGLFYPQSTVLKDALGESWLSFGASRIRVFELNQRKVAHDWQAVSQRDNGNSIFILTGSLGWVMPMSEPGASTEPYFSVRGGLAYIDYAVDTTSGRESGKRIGGNVNASIGILFNKRLNLEARYDWWSEFDGLKFNGLTLSAKYGIVRF